MTPKEYLALFDTLVAWGHDDDVARRIIHDYMEKLAQENDDDE